MIALLHSTSPVLKCTIHTDQNGDFSLCAKNHSTIPNIQTLSYLDENDAGTIDEVLLFPSLSTQTQKQDTPIPLLSNYNLIQIVPHLKGITDRLHDAAVSKLQNRQNHLIGDIEEFLQRSEAVMTELLYAVQQYTNANESKKRSIIRNPNFESKKQSIDYLTHLFLQLNILHKYEINQNISIIESVSDILNQVTLICIDDRERKHSMHLDIPPSFPFESPYIMSDLPIPFQPQWIVHPDIKNSTSDYLHNALITNGTCADDSMNIEDAEFNYEPSLEESSPHSPTDKTDLCNQEYGLVHIYKCFQKTVSILQPLWNELDDIDANTWVLEPSLPARYSSISRRIALLSNVSISFDLDISSFLSSNSKQDLRSDGGLSSVSLPPSKIRFIGAPASTILQLRQKYQSFVSQSLSINLQSENNQEQLPRWRNELSIIKNFTHCFGSLPSPTTTKKTEYEVECGICYTHRLPISSMDTSSDTEDVNETTCYQDQNYEEKCMLPDESCENPKCARSYHHLCLYEWLNALPSARVNFDRIFGTCPYCCEPVSVKIPFDR